MAVEIFDRAKFEKALGFLPTGYKLVGANGQLIYKAPLASKVRCPRCKEAFFPPPGEEVTCPYCGQTNTVGNHALRLGECFVMIYSSIDPISGQSRDTGEDSIRLVLVRGDGKPIAKKGTYITRVPGWEVRIRDKMRELWQIAVDAPRCRRGHKASLSKVRSGENKGRTFWKCWECQQWLGWADK